MPPLTLVFDLDGTMVDSAPDLIRATNYILRRLSLPEAEPATIRSAVGHGAKVLLTRVLAERGHSLGDGRMDALVEEFIDYYGRNIAQDSRPFPGLIEVLSAYSKSGARLAVCTNKREELSRKLLAALRLDHFFHAILGGDSLPVRKPDPGHVLGAIAAAGGDPRYAVMIGDSQADVDSAKGAGIPVIGVTFGYTATPVGQLRPDRVIAHFDELQAAVDALRPRRGLG